MRGQQIRINLAGLSGCRRKFSRKKEAIILKSKLFYKYPLKDLLNKHYEVKNKTMIMQFWFQLILNYYCKVEWLWLHFIL